MISILIGNIASGKSSYAAQMAKRGAIVINDDSIVNAVHGGNYQLYDKDLKPLYKSIEISILLDAVLLERDVIIDRGLDITEDARKRWLSLAKSLEIPCKAVVFNFDSPTIHAQRRVVSDNRGYDFDYWYKVANRMNIDYEEPTKEEGFSEIEYA